MKRQIQFSILVFLMLFFIGCGGRQSTSIKAKVEAPSVESLPRPGYFFTPGLPMFAPTSGLERTALEKRIRQRLKRTLEGSPALNFLAREYAARFGADGQDPSPSTVYALASHCGYWTKAAKSTQSPCQASTSWKLTATLPDPHSGRQRIGGRTPRGRTGDFDPFDAAEQPLILSVQAEYPFKSRDDFVRATVQWNFGFKRIEMPPRSDFPSR